MADNTVLDAGAGGDTIRDKDRAGVKTQIVALDLNPAGSETLMSGAMPVTDNSGSLTVDAPVATPVFVRLSDGSAAIATLPVSAASLPLPSGAATAAKQPALGTAGSASADVISVQGIASMTALKVDGSAVTQPVSGTVTSNLGAPTSGGLTQTKLVSAASTNATSLKASAGQVYSVQAFNTNAAARYLKLYNKASSPTVGTDTPVKTLLIPGNTAGAGLVLSWPQGIAFGTGIAYAITSGMADADTGAVGAADVVVNLDYS